MKNYLALSLLAFTMTGTSQAQAGFFKSLVQKVNLTCADTKNPKTFSFDVDFSTTLSAEDVMGSIYYYGTFDQKVNSIIFMGEDQSDSNFQRINILANNESMWLEMIYSNQDRISISLPDWKDIGEKAVAVSGSGRVNTEYMGISPDSIDVELQCQIKKYVE